MNNQRPVSRFGQDELAFCSDLGLESETEEEAVRRGARWVVSRGGKIRKTRGPHLTE